ERREQAEIDVHRLEGPGFGAAGDVAQQGAERGRRRWWDDAVAEACGCGEMAGEEADRGALDVAFDPGDLAGEAQSWHRLEPQLPVEQARAVDKGVAVQPAEPG